MKMLGELVHIAETHNVNILHAAEAGSRAWGFSSENSDFDIRFIYAHPMKHYLSFNVELMRDVLEVQTQNPLWDICGWDIRKALGLFTRSNGALLEWLQSPICYIESTTSEKLQTIATDHFNPTALMFHYYRMATNNAREFLRGRNIPLKKYLYVLRALIAVDFIRERRALPNVDFLKLVEETRRINADVAFISNAIEELVYRKRKTHELGVGIRIPVLDTYIENALAVNTEAFVNFKRDDLRSREWDDLLNEIFREAVGWYEN